MNTKLFEDIRNLKEPELLIESCVLNEFFIDPESTISKYNLTQDTNWSNPSILPNRFDQTWKNWFKRIGMWGTIRILHVDPEKNTRNYISQDAFLKRMGNGAMQQVYGKWEIQQSKIHRMEFWNNYVDMSGKAKKEIIQVSVDLKPELRKGLHWLQFVF